MSQENDKIQEELTIEQLTAVIGEIPFVINLGPGQEYAGPPDKKLAFAVSEELGLEGAAALLRFANLCVSFAKLGGDTQLAESTKAKPKQPIVSGITDQPLTALLDNSLKPREEANKKDQEHGTSQAQEQTQ